MVAGILVMTVIYLSIINTQLDSYLLRLSIPVLTYAIGYLIGGMHENTEE